MLLPLWRGPYSWIDGLLNSLAPLYGDVVIDDRVFANCCVHGSNVISSVDADRLAAYIGNENRRLTLIEHHCERLGVPFAGRSVLHNLLGYCELQVIVAKLRATTVSDRIDVLRLTRTAIRVGRSHPHSTAHRLLRAAWIIGVAILPRWPAEAMIRLRYVPSSRPRLFDMLIDVLGRRSVQQ